MAQIRALLCPLHPKDAVWLSAGTSVPEIIDEVPEIISGLTRISHASGTLLTTDQDKAHRFMDAPTDDTLAAILGYAEPKSAVTWPAVVVQARDGDGGVVHESLVSAHRVDEALKRAEPYGKPVLMTLPGALLRRHEIWLRETSCP